MSSTRRSLAVFAGLLLLTTATLLLSFTLAGTLGIVVALAIAAAKALLVAWWFMHLDEEPPSSRFALLAGVLMALLLVSGVITDVALRIEPSVQVPESR